MYLVEQHRIYKDNSYFNLLDNFCFNAKNLYNNGLYYIRQYYFYQRNIKEGKPVDNLDIPNYVIDYMRDKGSYIDYYKLDYIAKQLNNSLTDDYKSLPLASSAQSVLKQLHKNWLSFFKSLKKYNANSNGYTGRPKAPKYLDKKGRYILTLTNQNCKIKDNLIRFPTSFNGFTLKTKQDNLKEVRIIPKSNYYQIEVVYKRQEQPLKEDNQKYLSVDLGVNNLAAITNNFNGEQWLIKGQPLKSINQYYNKNLAFYKSIAKKENKLYWTKKLQSLTQNRNDRINTYLHKASKQLVNLAVSYGVSKIIIGYNEGWKQEVDLGKKTNQNFVSIPFDTFINYVNYKARLQGIEVIKVEESYTSGTDFLAKEMPTQENYNKSRRIKRGLFKSNTKRLLNSDVNGSYQILKKYLKENYIVTPNNLRVLQIV